MLSPPESAQNWFGLVSAAATVPRLSVAAEPGAGAISSSAVLDVPHTWIGPVNTPDRQSTVAPDSEFSFAAIHEFTLADVAPDAAANVTAHDDGAAIGAPVGVAGLGISPSPSTGTTPAGSIGNALADTGGTGWVTAPLATRGDNATPAAAATAKEQKTINRQYMALPRERRQQRCVGLKQLVAHRDDLIGGEGG